MPVSDAREKKRKKKRITQREKENKRSKEYSRGVWERRHAALGLHIIDYIVYRDLYLGNE